MDVTDLRIALTSGNYNYTRDGANQALNRLVGYLLGQGAAVRVYSPTVAKPAFPATGDLVGVPAIPFPFGRAEYRAAIGLPGRVRRDLAAFAPNIVHASAPDLLGHRAVSWARHRALPAIASVHTRFETYPRYYGLGFLEAPIEAGLRRFYNRCDAILAPTRSMMDLLAEQRMNATIRLWSRGVDHATFNPGARDLAWRRGLGIADDAVVIGFLGRLVLEKGLDVFGRVMTELQRRGVPHRVLVVGKGPAADAFREAVPGAVLAGFQQGADLGRAVAAMDVLLNPSVTETFGNVTLEAMACGVPVVAADATGSASLVEDGVTGRLVREDDIGGYADAIADYVNNPGARRAAGLAGSHAAEAFRWDAINRKVVDAYLEVLARR